MTQVKIKSTPNIRGSEKGKKIFSHADSNWVTKKDTNQTPLQKKKKKWLMKLNNYEQNPITQSAILDQNPEWQLDMTYSEEILGSRRELTKIMMILIRVPHHLLHRNVVLVHLGPGTVGSTACGALLNPTSLSPR
jgi:hypothetical protein